MIYGGLSISKCLVQTLSSSLGCQFEFPVIGFFLLMDLTPFFLLSESAFIVVCKCRTSRTRRLVRSQENLQTVSSFGS